MPYPWTTDDLLFAVVRASHLEPPRQVAEDLLSAADRPGEGLAGVTPLQARLRAADVLIGAGLADEAIAVGRDAVRAEGQDTDGRARMQASGVLAEAGAADEAAALALALVQERPGPDYGFVGYLVGLSLLLAGKGYVPQAVQVVDEAVASASSMPGSDGRFHYSASVRDRDRRVGQIKAEAVSAVEKVRDKILDMGRRAAADGEDPVEAATCRRREARTNAAAEIAAQRPWPSLTDGRLLWWPSAEYGRLLRQVPEVTGILGGTWRDHTARVESFMSSASRADRTARLLLAHADFAKFAAYLEHSGADPRLSAVQTAFTFHAGAGYHYPARWPPGGRYPCWCGSGRKYQRCCGTAPATKGG
jgi:hypothetical protein